MSITMYNFSSVSPVAQNLVGVCKISHPLLNRMCSDPPWIGLITIDPVLRVFSEELLHEIWDLIVYYLPTKSLNASSFIFVQKWSGLYKNCCQNYSPHPHAHFKPFSSLTIFTSRDYLWPTKSIKNTPLI